MSSSVISEKRVGVIDAFRALTMFLMVFVNDMSGVAGLPHWLHHAATNEDMMGFSDLVFPAFLFCVGMSIPFAVQSRYRKGDTPLDVLSHIGWRTLALVVMGLFTLKMEMYEGGMNHRYFTLLTLLAFFLIWNVPSKRTWVRKYVNPVFKVMGILLLLWLTYDRFIHQNPVVVGWWGILGLIGWTYGVCALIFVFSKGSLKTNLLMAMVVLLLGIVSNSGVIPRHSGFQFLLLPFVPSDWTLHFLGMAGIVTSLMLQRFMKMGEDGKFLRFCMMGGVLMLVMATLSHPFWIISKNQATPTWVFYCLALFLPFLALLYWVTERKGWTQWLRPIRTAGTSTLTCYMLPYLWYALKGLSGISYPAFLNQGVPGLLRSIVFSLLIIYITELLGKINIKLKI